MRLRLCACVCSGSYCTTAESESRAPGDSTREGDQLSPDVFRQRLVKYAKDAGVVSECTAHTLRRTFAVIFYQLTHDIEGLRQLLGHADIETTQGYLAGYTVEQYFDSARESNAVAVFNLVKRPRKRLG